MKQHLVLTGFLLLTPACGFAQVTVNPAALQQLAGIAPPPPVVEPVAAPMHHWVHVSHSPVAPKPAAPKPSSVQQAAARVPQAAAKPAAPVPPKPPAAITLAFAPGSSDLPADAAAALKPFCAAPGQVAVDARAPAVASDPSAAMRLSLARAFAVRDALAACGVAPQNILPRADGAVAGQNEDVTTIGSAAAK